MSNPSGPQRWALFNGAAVITGTSQPVNARQYASLAVYVTAFGTISTGSLLIEEADWPDDETSPFQGTWSTTETIDLTAFTGGGTAGDQTKIVVPSAAPGRYAFAWLRARFATDVTGSNGAVAVTLVSR
jgi:hypothetical protein